MPARFTTAFANRLDKECQMRVSEAQNNDGVEPGHVYIAPGSHHLEIARVGGRLVCALNDAPPVSGHRPSVDVLFRSGARILGATGIGVILTGMGKDGAAGMLEFRRAGAATLGQDEASSLIYGMPRAAFECGAVARQHPLAHMADAILEACGVATPPGAQGHLARAAPASEASGQRGNSIEVRAHSASEDARERAGATRPEPGSSARAG
jgi:two-component system chemotaxis response regulator CheB